MTVGTKASRVTYAGDGATKLFAVPFRFLAASDLVVSRRAGSGQKFVLILGTDYSVSGVDAAAGGAITLLTPPALGDRLSIVRRTTPDQQTIYVQNDPFPAKSHERALDKVTMLAQETQGQADRALVVPDGYALGGELPTPDELAGKYLAFGVGAVPVASQGTGNDAAFRGDMAGNGGPLVGLRQAVDLPPFALQLIFNEVLVAAHYFRKPTDPDDTLSLQRALATGFTVRLAAGKGTGPNGEYYLTQQDATGATSLIRRNNVRIIGDGKTSTVVRPNRVSGYALHGTKNTPDPANNYRGITINDIGFVGWVDVDGFDEHTHLISLSGVTDVTIERCSFANFRGDAIYFGQGNIGGQEIHNERCTVKDCYFDGVTNNNRNAISFIDIDTSLVDNCTFVRCSRPGQAGFVYPTLPGGGIDFPAYYVQLAANKLNPNWGPGMPGPIDFEPDANNARILNSTVRNCTFWGCSGNVGNIGVQIPPSIPEGNVRGLKFINNTFRQNFQKGGAEIHVHIVHALANPVDAAEPSNQILIAGNTGYAGDQAPINVFCAKGVAITDNNFTDYSSGCILGYVPDSRSMNVYDLTLTRNRFTRCASGANRIALTIFGAENLTVEGNVFDDCGDGSAFANVIDFNVGTSKNVKIRNNVVVSPTGKTAFNAILKEVAHTFTPGTNQFVGNDLGGRRSFFEAQFSDAPMPYTPIIEGGNVPGAGTYTSQYGEYTQDGGWVQGYARVTASGHTGTGVIEVSVPVDPADLAGPDYPCEVVVLTSGAGVPGAGKQVVAQVHGFASVGGTPGAIRIYTYDPATGQRADLPLANVGYTIYVRFAYRAQNFA